MGNRDWETPQPFFDLCNAIWGPFEVDGAADGNNSKVCDRWLDESFDSLKNDWPFEGHKVWLNPPYVNLGGWVDRVLLEAEKRENATVLLSPMPRGDAWIRTLREEAELVEVDGRIRFIDPEKKGRIAPVGGNILGIVRPRIRGVEWPTGYTGMRVQANGPKE